MQKKAIKHNNNKHKQQLCPTNFRVALRVAGCPQGPRVPARKSRQSSAPAGISKDTCSYAVLKCVFPWRAGYP